MCKIQSMIEASKKHAERYREIAVEDTVKNIAVDVTQSLISAYAFHVCDLQLHSFECRSSTTDT